MRPASDRPDRTDHQTGADHQPWTDRRRNTARAPRALAVVAGIAGALALSACGQLGGGNDHPCGTPAAGCVQISSTDEPTDDPGTEGTVGADGIDGTDRPGGEETGGEEEGGSGEDQTTPGPQDGEIRTESLAGDESIDVDEDGNGVVPAAALEADIEDLFVNKYDIDVTEVECRDDMKVVAEHGSQNCEIRTEERTFFGTIGIRGFEGVMVEYELYFPGLDEDALDL